MLLWVWTLIRTSFFDIVIGTNILQDFLKIYYYPLILIYTFASDEPNIDETEFLQS
jgi:hypothetical protein